MENFSDRTSRNTSTAKPPHTATQRLEVLLTVVEKYKSEMGYGKGFEEAPGIELSILLKQHTNS